MLRKLTWLLIVELLAVANAGASFHFFSRFAAGLWAGSCFVAIGVYILWKLYNWNFQSRSPLFWIAAAHTFAFSIPMVVTRVITPFDEPVQAVLYFPIELFHRASTVAFGLLIGATVIEMAFEILKMREKTPKI